MVAFKEYIKNLVVRLKEAFSFVRAATPVLVNEVVRQRVLVIIPHDKSWWVINAVQQFVSTLREQMSYRAAPEIDIVSVQSNYEVLSSLLMTVHVERQYQLVVTVGSWVTREVRDFFDGIPNPPPQIFCGVVDPVGLGVVDSLELPGRAISGVAVIPFNFDLQIEMLVALAPGMRSIALLCGDMTGVESVSSLLERTVSQFEQACVKRNIEMVRVVMNADSPVEEVRSLLCKAREEKNVRMVCILNDLFVSAHMELILDACKGASVPLCASELSSVYHGAALGFGENGGVYGMYCASLAYEVLVNHRPLSTLPVMVPPVQQTMRYNYDAMVAQGLVLDPAVCHLLSMVSVFFHSRH